MNSKTTEFEDVLLALKRTSKGRLSYDRNWKEERRTQEIINDVKLKTSSLTISPKSVQKESQTKSKCFVKYKVIESSNNETKNGKQTEDKTSDEIKTKSDESLRINVSKNKLNESVNDLDLISYEKQRQESVAQELDKKMKSLETEFKKCDEEFDEELKLIRQKYTLDAFKRVNALAEDYKALKESIFTKQMSFEDNSMTTSFKLKEIESKHQLIVEEQQRKQTDLRRKQLMITRNEIELVVKSVIQLSNNLESVVKNDQYFHTLKQELNSMIALLQNIDILLTKPDLNELDINKSQNFKLHIISIQEKILSDIQSLKQSIQKSIHSKPIVDNISVDETDSSSVDKNRDNSVSDFVDIKAFKEYLNLQKISNDFENSFQIFSTEKQYKQKRNELQLMVKTTINTISCESVEHIKDKLDRLTQLFNQRPVEYGGKQINCSTKDGSFQFCISLSSKMFVSVCTKQKDIALTMAPIVVLLWSRFPTFGQIFLAQMQEKCPYIVPYYPKPEVDDNETNYLIACGYTVNKDGSTESEESFLNRMRAMVKLYSAVIQSNVETNHPQGLRYGWNWVSRVLNLEPRPAITAAILESFLSISSHKFYRFYGKQFIKIIEFLSNDYLKRIENVSQKGTKRQSLVKLQMFCQQIQKQINRKASHKELAPEGLIPNYFFQSSFSHSRQTFAFN